MVVLARADSALVQFGTSGSDGAFRVRRLGSGMYVLRVSHVGFKTIQRVLVMDSADVDVGLIELLPQATVLEELVVTEDRLPYVVRGDTIIYNALAFFLRPQDMVEDLLRRLPGVEVDRNGTIIAQGKVVEHVLVEGREFFSNDPTIATRNLPADAVDGVQIYDQASDREELTGIADGQEEKTINLQLTQEAKRGAFGQTTGGLGGAAWDDGRYFGRASAFRFAPRTQLALIGNADNVNQPGFSQDQLRSFRGAGSPMRAESGFGKSLGGGFNANSDLGDHTTWNASYLVTDYSNTSESVRSRQELLGSDFVADGDEVSLNDSEDLAHSVAVKADSKLGEGHDLKFEGTLSRAISSATLSRTENTLTLAGAQLNIAQTTSSRDAGNLTGSSRLTWRKRVSERGHSMIVTSTVAGRTADTETQLSTHLQSFRGMGPLTQEALLQQQDLASHSFNHTHRLEFVLPIRGSRVLTWFMQLDATQRHQDKDYFDVLDGHRMLNGPLSGRYRQQYRYWRSGTDFTVESSDRTWWMWTTLQVQHSNRQGSLPGNNRQVRSRFTHLLVRWLAQRDVGDAGTLKAQYYTRTIDPTLRQLQPFTDNSNPLRLYVGNPALTPEYRHDLGMGYARIGDYSDFSLRIDLNVASSRNSIVYERQLDARLRQIRRPINTGSARSAGGGVSVGRPIRSVGLDFDYDIDWADRIEFVNKEESRLTALRHRFTIRVDYLSAGKVGVFARGGMAQNRIEYSLNSELDQGYLSGIGHLEAYWHPSEAWSFESMLEYEAFDRDWAGSRQQILLLDLSFSRIIASGRGTVEVELHDVLDHGREVSVVSAATYVEERHQESLGWYVMLKLTYKPRLM